MRTGACTLHRFMSTWVEYPELSLSPRATYAYPAGELWDKCAITDLGRRYLCQLKYFLLVTPEKKK